jgi:UDP-N-acetylmuramate--alanine ligase
VAETDESDGTLCCFHPEHALLLNIDADHLDYFRNLEAVCHEFGRFVQQVRGWRIYCKDDPHLGRLLDGQLRTISFGFHSQADYRIEAIAGTAPGSRSDESVSAQPQAFRIWHRGAKLGRFTTKLLGDKNLSNAAAVVALLHQLGYGAEQIVPALAPFDGAARRQELIFHGEQVSIYDDYGHHPSEVRAVLQALKSVGARRLLVAFQPHRYTRTQHLLADFATCFHGADQLWLTDIYPANEAPLPGVNGAVLAQAVRARGQEAHYVPALSNLGPAVRKAVQPGDLVLFLGAGDITKVAHEVAEQYRRGSVSVPQLDQAAEGPLMSPACVCGPLLAWPHLAPAATLEVLG